MKVINLGKLVMDVEFSEGARTIWQPSLSLCRAIPIGKSQPLARIIGQIGANRASDPVASKQLSSL
jgi:hypothetical protein